MGRPGGGYQSKDEVRLILADPISALRALRIKQKAYYGGAGSYEDVVNFEVVIDRALGLPRGRKSGRKAKQGAV